MNPRRLDLVGRRFGRLLVIGMAPPQRGFSHWLCECDCGNTKVVRGTSLTSNAIRSCGCLHREQAAVNIRIAKAAQTKTGLSRHATYGTWTNMKHRCSDPSNINYPRYGGRGIRVCERWMDYGNFIADMGLKPPRMTLERINNDADYQPGNCRWASKTEQANNRRSNHLLSLNGRSDTIANWSRKLRIPMNVLRGRVYRGWPDHKALTVPVGYGKLPNGQVSKWRSDNP